MAFLHALAGVFSLLLVVALGYALARLGWFPAQTRRIFPRLVTNVSLPPFLGITIMSSFQRESLLHMLYGAAAPMLAMCLLFVLAWIVGRLMKVDRRHFGLFCACVSNPNTIFIGIPVNLALFGHDSLAYVLLYYFASTLFFWTVGNYFISRDQGSGAARDSAFHWRKLIPAPMYGFILGVLFVCLDIRLPDFLFQSCRIVGELTTPLALIFIGMTLEGMPLAKLRPGRDMIVALAGRMFLSPLLMWTLVRALSLPGLMGDVFIIQSSLPVLMQVAILSAYYDTDPDFGSVMVSLSTLICVVTVPVYMALL